MTRNETDSEPEGGAPRSAERRSFVPSVIAIVILLACVTCLFLLVRPDSRRSAGGGTGSLVAILILPVIAVVAIPTLAIGLAWSFRGLRLDASRQRRLGFRFLVYFHLFLIAAGLAYVSYCARF